MALKALREAAHRLFGGGRPPVPDQGELTEITTEWLQLAEGMLRRFLLRQRNRVGGRRRGSPGRARSGLLALDLRGRLVLSRRHPANDTVKLRELGRDDLRDRDT